MMSRTLAYGFPGLLLCGLVVGCGMFQQEPAESAKGIPCDGSFEADFYGSRPEREAAGVRSHPRRNGLGP